MFKNYIITAIRNFWKNKLFAVINIIGLAVGLMVFVFANLFADYESNHDAFFENSERIYTVRSEINPSARLGIQSLNTSYLALAPFIRQDIPGIEKTARLIWSDLIVSHGDTKFYQPVHMVEPQFLDIFKMDFIQGRAEGALSDLNSVVLTEETANRFFGRTDVLGENLTLNNQRDLRVTGVIKDLPLDSHFSGNMMDEERLAMFVNYEIGADVFNAQFIDNWNSLSISNRIYILLTEGVNPASVEPKLNALLVRYGPEDIHEIVSSIGLRPLRDMNLAIWSMIGVPAIAIIRALGLLVLIIACINFINLATAQALGRAREIGIRKTMGASRARLAIQFLVESVVVAFFALILGVAIIEYVLPLVNTAFNKDITFSYFSDPSMAIFLGLTVLAVGLFSGAFPALLLSRLDAAKALHGNMALGRWSLLFRKILVGSQNTFSVFLVVTVLLSFIQMDTIKNLDLGFDHENRELVLRTNREGINENYEILRDEFLRIPGVISASGSSQYPFEQSNNSSKVMAQPGDIAAAITINRIFVDYKFLQDYGVPLLSGRHLSEDFSGDIEMLAEGGGAPQTHNILINKLASDRLGFATPEDALGKTIYREFDTGRTYPMVVVGVTGNANFQGFHNEQKPFVFSVRPGTFASISVHYEPNKRAEVLAAMEQIWNRILPEYPLITLPIGDAYDDMFGLYQTITGSLVGFAVMALFIATFGLFGLSAFMAEKRIREVGVRKTFGASTAKIVQLLVFQFSKPVLWAVLVGWLLAIGAQFLISSTTAATPNTWLVVLVFLAGGVFSLVLAWITVGANAYRAATTSPAVTLSYE